MSDVDDEHAWRAAHPSLPTRLMNKVIDRITDRVEERLSDRARETGLELANRAIQDIAREAGYHRHRQSTGGAAPGLMEAFLPTVKAP